MLQKGAEYIKQLKAERNQIKEEMESLRQQIECLNNSITYVFLKLFNLYIFYKYQIHFKLFPFNIFLRCRFLNPINSIV